MAKITKKQKSLAGKVDSNKLYPLADAIVIVKDAAIRTLAGSARSMGITVEGL